MSIQTHVPDTTLLTISSAAKAHFINYLNGQDKAIGLLLFLKKYGCSGYAYEYEILEDAPDDVISVELNAQYTIFIKKESYPLIKGTHIDYIQEGLSRRVTYENPRQTGECGCGESFVLE